jgi:hypothetical protein
MRRLNSGNGPKLIKTRELFELFDVKYPWLPDITVTEDGVAYFAVAQQREGSDVIEGLIYRVTGL